MLKGPTSQPQLIQPIDVPTPASSTKCATLVLFLLGTGNAAILAVRPSVEDSIQLKLDQQVAI